MHSFNQLDFLGICPSTIKWTSDLILKTHKGHITIVPSASIRDYINILVNVTKEDFELVGVIGQGSFAKVVPPTTGRATCVMVAVYRANDACAYGCIRM